MDNLVNRLRGQYAMGPHTPNGNPEFGWRQFESPPIQHEAADRIEALEAENARLLEELGQLDAPLDDRMAALGMIPMSTLLSEPPTSFSVHVGVNSMASFANWLEKKHESFLKMRMRYEVGMKPKDDELFEWIFAHSAAFRQVCDHFRAALKETAMTDYDAGIEAAATVMDTAAHIMSQHGSEIQVQTYQNAAKNIRALIEQENGQ